LPQQREIDRVESSHLRGRDCLVQAELVSLSPPKSTQRDADGVVQRIPQTFSTAASADRKSVSSLTAHADTTLSREKHYHLGSANPNEYCSVKFYSFNAHVLGCLFGNRVKGDESSLPFKMTSKEYEVARLNPPKPCGILLMGRSGTGKTSVQVESLDLSSPHFATHS
jgi:hypothetical protein